MKKWVLALVLGSLVGCSATDKDEVKQATASAVDGVSFIEQVKAKSGETVIPYKKYRLENGLTILIHEDHSDPLVHVNVTYHVGSAREEMGKSGFAHFFEHMMFQGSEHVADEEHFKIITEAGGTLNGSTNSDRTNYYQTVPANNLETMLWLEADRMGFLLNAVTQEKFEVQRETVKNERGQRVDNRPYGQVGERVSAAMYPPGHPYSWPVIGFMDDLNRVNVNDLKKFFLRWYGPNNATLTVGGDIKPEHVLKLVEKYFGSIPRGPEVNMPQKALVTLPQDRYISMQDNVHLPLFYMSFPTVHSRHPDEAPLDILSEILGGGKTSILYQNLVKNQIAVQAAVSHPCRELSCEFNLYALPHPASGKSLSDIEKIIRDSLDEFEKRGVEDDDLTKVKAMMEANFVFALQSVEGKASNLAAYETFTGNPNWIEQDIARYNGVTKADVMRVFKKYIKGQHAVVLSVLPKGQAVSPAAPDNFTLPKRTFETASTTTAEDLNIRTAKDDFDRSQKPKPGPAASVDIPVFWQETMDNGLKVLGSQSSETPTTSMLIRVPAGHYYESMDKTGTAEMLASMLSESTLKRSAEAMSQQMRMLGSSVSITSDNHYINININSLTKRFDETLALVQEQIWQPAFNESDFARLQGQMLQALNNNKKDADYLAARAYQQLMFGNTIAGTPRTGTEASIGQMTVADVKAFYQRYFKPARAQLIVVSDLTQSQLRGTLNSFVDWQGVGPELALELPAPDNKKGVVYLVNKDKAAQSAIRLGKRGMKFDVSGEFYRASLMNYVLGGNFNSRINLNLREDKGYTYGASTGFWGDRFAGGFTAWAEVRADATGSAIEEFVKEIGQYQQKGIDAAELLFTKNAINQQDALKYETPDAKLSFLAQILEYNLSPDFVATRSQILADISRKEINQLAKKHLDVKQMIIVVVGDAKALKPELEALGYEVIDHHI